jgi:hypothetical protein
MTVYIFDGGSEDSSRGKMLIWEIKGCDFEREDY